MDFNPNQPPPQCHWATYVPGRKPEFKVHKQVNHAKGAFQYRDNAILYRWDRVDSKWIEIWRIEDRDKKENCDRCSGSFMVKSSYPVNSLRLYREVYARWVGRNDQSRYLLLCRACYKN